jgi:HK97 family phage major capsid protein
VNKEKLMREYQQLCADQRKMLDHASNENRDLNAEESQSYDRMTERLGEITKSIERLNALEVAEQRMQEVRNPIPAGLLPGQGTRGADGVTENSDWSQFHRGNRGEPEYRKAFASLLRSGSDAELRALGTGSVGAGSALVPKWLYTEVVKYLQQAVRMRQLATVRTSDTNMDIPIIIPPTAAWKAESAAYTDTDPTFENKTLTARKLTCLVKIPEELLADAAIDLEDEVMMSLQVAFAQAEEKAFLVGTGSGDNQPRGVVLDAGVGKTAAATGAVTADEILDLFYSLKSQYRDRAVMFMNDATLAAIRKLKSAVDGHYIWVQGFGTNPGTIEGRPVYTNSNIATMAADAKTIIWGDMSYYRIQDRPGIFAQTLRELYAGNGQVGYRMYKRTDGALTVAEAVKVLQMDDGV